MELKPMHRRVIALDVHQAKITACAIVEHDDGRVEMIQREFGAFKRDRRELVLCPSIFRGSQRLMSQEHFGRS